MPHKLKITLSIEPQVAEEVRPFLESGLTELDAIRGVACKLILTIRNISESPFPGGRLTNMGVTFGPAYQQMTVEPPVIPLASGETAPRTEVVVVPVNPGMGIVRFNVVASDPQPVVCYQRDDSTPVGTGAWLDVFYVVDRETLNMILLP